MTFVEIQTRKNQQAAEEQQRMMEQQAAGQAPAPEVPQITAAEMAAAAFANVEAAKTADDSSSILGIGIPSESIPRAASKATPASAEKPAWSVHVYSNHV